MLVLDRRTGLPFPFSHLLGIEEFIDDNSNKYLQKYPPHNVIKKDDNTYIVEISAAGFKKDEIDIYTHEGNLIINGEMNKEVSNSGTEFIHKGISQRKWEKSFKLPEHGVVKDATFENGILRIEVFEEIPEALKPKQIKIN